MVVIYLSLWLGQDHAQRSRCAAVLDLKLNDFPLGTRCPVTGLVVEIQAEDLRVADRIHGLQIPDGSPGRLVGKDDEVALVHRGRHALGLEVDGGDFAHRPIIHHPALKSVTVCAWTWFL